MSAAPSFYERSKREIKKADVCKGLQLASIESDAVANIANDFASIPGMEYVTPGIAVAGHLAKAGLDMSYVVMDCSDIPFDEIKDILTNKFYEMDHKMDQHAEALQSVYDLSKETLTAVEATRKEMKEGFERVMKFIESSKTKQIVSEIDTIVQYIDDEMESVHHRSREDFVVKLQERDSILQYMKKSRTADEGTLYSHLHSIMNQELAIPADVNDKQAIRALYALFYGTQTFVSIMFYLMTQYSYLADFHYQKGRLEEFNSNFDQIKSVFQDFKFFLIGSSRKERIPLIDKVIAILKTVKEKYFVKYMEDELYKDIEKRAESLSLLKEKIQNMDLSVLADSPKTVERISFGNRNKDIVEIRTPILKWRKDTEVRYAVQYQNDGKYSKISEWSDPVTIKGKAHPTIVLARDRSARLIFRKFQNEKPELVSILSASQKDFKDIDRDLFNVSGMPNSKENLDTATSLISAGANVDATFERGRNAIHSTAFSGNIRIAELLLGRNATLINLKDKGGFTPLHVAVESGRSDFVKFLVDKGADVNCQTNADLFTPLHLAANLGLRKITEHLMGSDGIDVNRKDRAGYSPLHNAVTNNISVVKLLISNENTELNSKSGAGFAPLHLAVLGNNMPIAKVLMKKEKSNVNEGDKDGMTALHYAAMLENLEMVNFLLSLKDVNVNSKTFDKRWSPLHFAIFFKNETVASRLLQFEGVDINISTEEKTTPLHLAAATGQRNVALDLITKEADMTVFTKDGYTALHLAIMRQELDITSVLVEKSANIEERTLNGDTPLHLAAVSGSKAIFQKLLDKEADIRAKDKNGQMPIHKAVANGNLYIVQLLVTRDPTLAFINSDDQKSPLYFAVQNNRRDIFGYLIRKGADVNSLSEDGMTLLLRFSKEGDTEAVMFLLENGANSQIKNAEGNDFFALAVQSGLLGVVEYAVDSKKIDLKVEDDEGHSVKYRAMCDAAKFGKLNVVSYFIKTFGEKLCSPLHQAAKYGHLDIVEFFVEKHGMTGEERTPNENSPLCLAIEEGHTNIVEYLVHKVRSIDSPCDSGENTPLEKAIRMNNLTTVKILVQNGANPNKRHFQKVPLYIAAEFDLLDIVKYLVEERNVNINVKNENANFTPLHAAVIRGNFKIVQYLVSKRADLYAKDTYKKTPFYYSLHPERQMIMEYFIKNGVNPKDKFSNGNTPLHYVALSGYFDLVKYFVEEHEVEVNVANERGSTPLHYAAETDRLRIVEYLLDKGADLKAENWDGETAADVAAPKVKEYLKSRSSRTLRNEMRLEDNPYLNSGLGSRSKAETSNLHGILHDAAKMNPSHAALSFSKETSSENSLNSYSSSIDLANSLLLLDVLIRRWTNQKYPTSVSASPLEAEATALELTEKFSQILNALTHNSTDEELDFSEIYSKIRKAVATGQKEEVKKVLCSYVRKLPRLSSLEIEHILSETEFICS